ncbi:MAG: tRNA-specific 2-thiouridylase [Rickettsiales bacterium]|jgi:tRNA-specific 2-thiouridylase
MINLSQIFRENEKKIVVAMSGGVDSSVVAAFLKKSGYDVIGITLQLYDHGEILKKKGACCAGADIYDAKKIAEKFDFPHYVLNYENLFKESVIEDFAESYVNGETPIPCIRCNQTVKFKDLLKVAKDLGADSLATGHYVRRDFGGKNNLLLKAKDSSKDQSYFLFTTTKEQLSFLRFPLGGLDKSETRKLAQDLDLEISNKPDSQDICFVPDGNYAKIVEKYRPKAFKKGDIYHVDERKLGTHEGIINYTIGQRKGLGLSSKDPLFVIKIDPKENKVIVGEEKYLLNKEFVIKEINWLGNDDDLDKEITLKVRLRSSALEKEAKINFFHENDILKANIILKDGDRAITKGQACVFYDNDTVMGGGWIEKIIN